VRWQLDHGLQQYGIRQVAWIKALVVQQPREAFHCSFLVAKAPCELRLATHLLVLKSGHIL
jgi:hypothetical protein